MHSHTHTYRSDVQTLHNRIIEIEKVLAQLQAAPASMSVSAALAGMPAFKQPNAAASASVVAGPSRAPPPPTPSLLAGLPCNDRALLAQGASGSSVVISLEDVVSLWLNELEELGFESRAPRTASADASGSMRPPPPTSGAIVKLEPTPVSIPSPSSLSVSPSSLPSSASVLGSPNTSTSTSTGTGAGPGLQHQLHPPAPYDAFLPPPSAGPSALPQVTAALVAYLPRGRVRARYLKAFRETMLLHPSFNVPHFEMRVGAVYGWAEGAEAGSGSANTAGGGASTGTTTNAAATTTTTTAGAGGGGAYGSRPKTKADLARDIFFSSAKPGSGRAANGAGAGNANGAGTGGNANAPKPTLSFFAAACAAFALGALVSRDDNPGPGPGSGSGGDPAAPSPSDNSSGNNPNDGGVNNDNNGGAGDGSDGAPGTGAGAGAGAGAGDASGTPAMLFALSEQALQLAEKTAAYDLDCVVAMIVQVLYMLHEGRMSVAQGVFPLVSGGFAGWGFGVLVCGVLVVSFLRFLLFSLSAFPAFLYFHFPRSPAGPFFHLPRLLWSANSLCGGLTGVFLCAGGHDGERGADDGPRDGPRRVSGDV